MFQSRHDKRAKYDDETRMSLLEDDGDTFEGALVEMRNYMQQEFKATRSLVLSLMTGIILAGIGTIITLVVTR